MTPYRDPKCKVVRWRFKEAYKKAHHLGPVTLIQARKKAEVTFRLWKGRAA